MNHTPTDKSKYNNTPQNTTTHPTHLQPQFEPNRSYFCFQRTQNLPSPISFNPKSTATSHNKMKHNTSYNLTQKETILNQVLLASFIRISCTTAPHNAKPSFSFPNPKTPTDQTAAKHIETKFNSTKLNGKSKP